MKKLKLFFALFAMLALGVGNAWGAEETVVYTLTPAAGSNNSYAGNCDITISDITWNLTGNSTMIPWRIGGKNLTGVDRTLYSKTVMPHKVTKIEVTHGTASSVTVNSFKLIVASDANFSNVISTVEETFTASATTTLTCPSGADWSNAFYKFVYNVTIGSSNKYILYTEAKFYGEASTTPGEGGSEDPVDPEPSTSTNWVETPIGDITASDMVVVTMTNASGTYAMSNNNGTSKAPTATKVEVKDGKLTQEPANEYKWNISNTSGSLTFYPNGSTETWLYCTNANNGVRVGTNTASAFTIDATSGYLKHTGTSRYLGVYNSADWRCYTNTTGNTANQTLKFYKYLDPNAATKPSAPRLTSSQEFETETFTVEISADAGTTIYYTLNGDEPTSSSNQYTAPFTINATTTVKAIAVKDGVASSVNSATYTKVSTIDATCAEAAAACSSTTSTDKYRVEGYVTEIVTAYSADFKNISFWMADTKNGGQVLQAYRAKEEVQGEYKDVKVGDKVQVVGKVVLFKSTTPEFIEGSLYKITEEAPIYNVTINSDHGTVIANPMSGIEGTEVTLTVETASGWVFDSWTVKDASNNDVPVADNKFTIPASNVTVTANYTASEAPDAKLILMANTQEYSKNTYKVGETVELPATIENDCVKMFVGWSANSTCAEAPEYAPGADFELTAAEHTLYAVYATENAGASNTSTISIAEYASANSWEDATKYTTIESGDITVSVTGGGNTGKYYTNGNQWRLYQGESATITVTIPENLSLSTIKFTYAVNNAGVLMNGTTQVKSNDVVSVSGSSATFSVGNTGTATNGQVRITAIEVVYNSAPTYSGYSTTCVGALAAPTFSVAEGSYTEAKSIELSATEGDIYYTLDGTEPTESSTLYTAAINLDECGTTTIKAIAISSESQSPVASATYTINLPITNTEATAYTPAEAIAIIDGACDKTEEVYVKGVVVSTSGLNTEYGNYDNVVVKAVDDESATPTEFTFFRLFKAAEETEFTASDEVIGVGDIITAKGKLTKYYSTYELAEGCYLVSRVANVKLDAELAWNPTSVTLTQGEAFTAPTFSNPNNVTVSFESSNDEVATVTAEGEIALASAIGTATITATFAGNENYKPAEVTCTIKVKPIPEDCEGSDDFATDESESPLSYLERTTAAGWKTTNAARVTIEDETYFAINGKTSTVGTITSPVLNGGIGSIKIRYANTYSESNGVSFRLDIKQNEEVVETYTITKANEDVAKGTVYTELIENINVAGDFQMVFTNLSPSESTSNKDRVSIGRLCWTGYVAPTPVAIRENLTKGNYYTICMNKEMEEIQGATLWSFCGKDANFAYLVQEDAPYTAGKAYIMYAEAETVSAILTGDEVLAPVANGAIHGTFADMDQDDLDAAAFAAGNHKIYLVIGNQLRRVDGQTGNSLPANRAYVDIDEITGGAPAGIPANRVRSMPMQPQVATGMENVDASAQPVKTIINGQLYILRGEKMYDAQGKLVK